MVIAAGQLEIDILEVDFTMTLLKIGFDLIPLQHEQSKTEKRSSKRGDFRITLGMFNEISRNAN